MRSLLAALALLAATPSARAGTVERFAIVIGNNHSDRADREALRYADDDAIAMDALLRDAGVHSVLLVSPDRDTAELHPELTPDGAPRWRDLAARFADVERAIRQAHRAGATTSLLVFYSGHGDVDHGEGHVVLEDARLTRTLLRDEILQKSSASEIHLVVDACRSYYLAFGKGPGGSRRAAVVTSLASGSRGSIGYILSTSSDRDSHEWEVFQGGIFSHEVRSAMRGAADVDRDGTVTYAELGAFLSVANRGIRNRRYRPDFVVRPPAALSDAILRWPTDREALLLDGDSPGRLYVEGPEGDRLLDVNPARGQTLRVRLPEVRPLFVRWQDSDREVTITDRAPLTRLSQLEARPPRVASKGAIHLAFGELFAIPFSASDVVAYREAVQSAGAPGLQDGAAATLDAAPRDDAPASSSGRRTAGAIAIVSGAAGLALGAYALERSLAARDASDQVETDRINGTVEDARIAAGVSLGIAAGATLVWWLLRDDDPAPTDRLTVMPAASDDAAGLAIGGRF